ncbi:alpha-L-rhamnosidase-related protein [Aquibacillus saliphilus]|uniref:alpha-L-rhamnosidase-related protein n=1 Tax=Aquibacillus saliphilus TaxID=1909422 RepID=UPI001CF07D95|nr:trehalase family glycosidase [Aquibacillus saliphilus]
MNWNAKWIWKDFLERNDNVYMEFRKTFILDTPEEDAIVQVSANHEYILWVNGHQIGRGPSPSDNDWQYFDEYNIHEVLLADQENIITALVYNFGSEDIVTQQYQGPGGFVLQLNTGNYELVTDQTWKCRQSKRWMQDVSRQHKWNGYKEVYLANQEDDWLLLDYDDYNWAQAHEVAATDSKDSPWKNLIKREIPFLHHEYIYPKNIVDISENYGMVTTKSSFLKCVIFDASKPGALPSLTYDFAREMVGYVEMEVDSPKGGVLQIYYGESLDVVVYDTFILKEGKNHIKPFGRRAFRYMKVVVQATPEPIIINNVATDFVHYPFGKRGQFLSNDPLLNEIWDVSVYTTKVNSQDHIEDTPLRERALWVVDAVIMARVIYQVFGDETLLKKCFRQIARIQNEDGSIPGTGPERNDMLLPDFCAHWIYGVWDYYQFTGEESFLAELWPTITRLMEWFEAHETEKGLFTINKESGIWCFIDWADYIDRRDQVSAISMFYYKALKIVSVMAKILGHQNHSQKWNAKADRLKTSIRTYLWNQKKNAYVDCLVGEDQSYSITYQTNFTAIWTGIMTNDEAEGFVEEYFVKDKLPHLKGPFFYHILLESLFSLNYHSLAMSEIKTYWGSMIERGATTWWEAFDLDKPTCTIPHEFQGHTPTYLVDYVPVSQCHGWGSSPGYLLNQHILGVDISKIGLNKVILNPFVKELNNVKGIIPTKYGDITVSWFKRSETCYEYHCTIPEELEWEGVFNDEISVFINGELHEKSIKGGETNNVFNFGKEIGLNL